jgi:XRE family transcriptional regulator, regulator of sulfur utilization
MEEITSIVGNNLKELRKSRFLTLETLSMQTGVSVSMLGEIERGITNPTITILWKIAEGLKIPFSELLKQDVQPVKVVHRSEAAIYKADTGFKILTLFGFDPQKKFEIYSKYLDPGAAYDSPGHPQGNEEFLIVAEGVLTLDIGEKRIQLFKGDAVKFDGAGPHTYRNLGKDPLTLFTLLYYGPG